ncbi:MAG: CHAT domain-containing protein [Acidobacteria bacterium]|nr:CHAT domain-containing protein [Acidobacteriota bacterium]
MQFPALFRTGLAMVLLLVQSVGMVTMAHPTISRSQTGPPSQEKPKITAVLSAGSKLERTLTNDESNTFELTLSQGQYLELEVEQKEIKLYVSLTDPAGKPVLEIESAYDVGSTEYVGFLAETTGTFLITVTMDGTPHNRPRKYEIRVVDIRPAQPADVERAAAIRSFMEAKDLADGTDPKGKLKALDLFDPLLVRFRAIQDKHWEVTTLIEIARQLNKTGQTRKAFERYQEVLPLLLALNEKHLATSILIDIATLHNTFGQPQKAIEALQQAISMAQSINHKLGLSVAYSNLGVVYRNLGENHKAVKYHERALDLRRETDDMGNSGALLLNMGVAYGTIGETQKALDHFEEALRVLRDRDDKKGQAFTLISMGREYINLGDPATAVQLYQQGLGLIRELNDLRAEANVLLALATTQKENDPQQALTNLDAALLLSRKIGDRRSEANILSALGIFHFNQGKIAEAEPFFSQALKIGESASNTLMIIEALDGLTQVYLAMKKYSEARSSMSRALELVQAQGNELLEAQFFYYLAQLESSEKNLEKSKTAIEKVLQLVESTRASFRNQNLRVSFIGKVQRYYHFYIQLLMKLHQANPAAGYNRQAFNVNERARARSLLDILTETRARIRQGVNPELLEQERILQQNLADQSERLTRLTNGNAPAEVQAEERKSLDTLVLEYESLLSKIRKQSPRYAALTQPEPLTLSEIQKSVVESGSLLLEYSLGSEQSFVWAISPTQVFWYELPKQEIIATAVKKVRNLLLTRNQLPAHLLRDQRGDRIKQAEQELSTAAAELSNLILAPVAAHLGTNRLLIVADGVLQYIPFAALPEPIGKGTVSGEATPLVVRHELVSLPSASTLAVLRAEATNKPKADSDKLVAVFADPVFEVSDPRLRQVLKRFPLVAEKSNSPRTEPVEINRLRQLTPVVKADGQFSIVRLPFTRQEATEIRTLATAAKTSLFLDFAANHTKVTTADIGKYQYLHFATHGLLDTEHPEFSALVLSLVDEKGNRQKGFLRMMEVYNLDLAAQLVVLSACETGLGKEIRGEGLIGLTRGFMYAGAPSVVVSLWSVSDQGTSELMKRFYRGLLTEKLRPAAALRKAQIELMGQKAWNSPFYWAPFIVQGEF